MFSFKNLNLKKKNKLAARPLCLSTKVNLTYPTLSSDWSDVNCQSLQ